MLWGLVILNSYRVTMTVGHSGWDERYSWANVVIRMCSKSSFVTEWRERERYISFFFVFYYSSLICATVIKLRTHAHFWVLFYDRLITLFVALLKFQSHIFFQCYILRIKPQLNFKASKALCKNMYVCTDVFLMPLNPSYQALITF